MGEAKGVDNSAFTDDGGHPKLRNGVTAKSEIPAENGVEKDYLKGGAEHKGKGKTFTRASLKEEFRINKELLPVKFATLFFHGGVFAFLPYVTLHMKQIGLTNEEVALTYAILPVSSILGPLISGMVADKLGAFKAVFLFNVIFTAVLHTLFVTVPYAPKAPELGLSCAGSEAQLFWSASSSSSCPLIANVTSFEHQQINMTLKNCKCGGLEDSGSNFTMCLLRNFRPECSQHDAASELQLSVDTGPLYSTANLPINDDPEKSYVLCSDELTPTIRNVSFQGQQYNGMSCSEHCELRCDVDGGPQFQMPQYTTTFWVYLALRVPAQFFLAAAMTMMDALTMAVIANRGGDFGKQRLVSMLSLASMPFISSSIVHYAPTDNGSPDYRIAFYFGDVLLVFAVALTAYMRLERPENQARNVLQDLRQLLTKLDIIVFLVVILVLGSNWGFLENFFFVYLSELKAPAYLLGLTLTFGCLVGLPAMFLSNRIIACMGRANIFILSFVAYSVRMFGYSIISNPWMSLPFEALEIITYQLMWVAAVTYFPILAPPTLLATMSGLSGTLHYNIGRGVGALLGGHLMGAIGSVNTFRVFGIISIVSGVVYAVLHYAYFKAKFENKDASAKEGVELTTDSKKLENGRP